MKVIILLFTLFLSGCSSIQIAFFFTDRLVANSISRSFNLTSRQEGMLREQIKKDLNLNKSEIGLFIDQLFESIEKMAAQELVTLDDIKKFDIKFINFRLKLVQLMKPSITHFVENIKDDQILSFKDNIKNSTEQKKIDGIKNTLKFFLGSVTDQQSDIIKNYVNGNADFYNLRSETRNQFSKKFLESISIDDKVEVTTLFLLGDNSIRSSEYIEKHKDFKESSFRMWYDIWQSMSLDQKKILIKNLKKYRSQAKETFT